MGSRDESKFCSTLRAALPTALVRRQCVPKPIHFLQASNKTSIGASKMIFSRRDVENLDPGPGVAKVLFPGFFFPRGASQGGRRAGLEEEALRV